MTLANGGTSYFAAKGDLSTLFDDLALARPTTLEPRPAGVRDVLPPLPRRAGPADPRRCRSRRSQCDDCGRDIREKVLGGRVLAVGCGSAALSPEIKEFMESMLDQHLLIGYSSTEIAGGMFVADEHVLRPPVIDYKLLDVPELGYFNTDKPYPRGELAVKSARFMARLLQAPRPRRRDVRRGRVLQDRRRHGRGRSRPTPLSSTAATTSSNCRRASSSPCPRLEALYSTSPLVRQIYVYGTSERAFLLAVVVPQGRRAQIAGDDRG